MCISEKEIQQMTDASFSQSESLKPCRGQSESSRWSLNASRDKWERNTEEIDLICAAVYINTIYSTEKGAVQRIHSFTNNIIREMKDLNHFTALFLSYGRMKLLHDLVILTNNNWKAFFKYDLSFASNLLHCLCAECQSVWTSEMFWLFCNYHLNIWDESTWSLSLSLSDVVGIIWPSQMASWHAYIKSSVQLDSSAYLVSHYTPY